MSEVITQATLQRLEGTLRSFVARRVREAEVDDVLQDVFLRLSRGVGTLEPDQRLEPWLFRAARSAIVDQYRARGRYVLAGERDGPEEAAEEPGEESDLQHALAGCVAQFVAELPSPYREALTLTELQGLTQREAAEILGVTLSGMKSRVQRGPEKLREAFDACCHIALDARGRVIDYVPRRPRCPDSCG